MKKIYQKPDTLLTVIALQQMIAGSEVEDGFDPNSTPTTDETSGNLSRRFSIWDDDED